VIDDKIADRYRSALLTELKLRTDEQIWSDGQLRSIYFGGGTPSLMPIEFAENLFDIIKKNFGLIPEIEVTIETNPGSGINDKFKEFHKLGINRLSIGAQSFHDSELKALGRIHSSGDISNAVQIARKSGFDNISLDLLYGIPGQTVDGFQASLIKALDLGINHLSTYALSIENDTPFAKEVKNGSLSEPDPDLAADQYTMLIKMMKDAGFIHYELTNFAKPGFESTHNKAYWQRTPYLGIGTASHSFDGQNRFWNARSTESYIGRIKSVQNPVDGCESLNSIEQLEEQLYLGLRTSDGISIETAREHFNQATLIELINDGFLVIQDNRYIIPEERWLLLDEVVLKILASNNCKP